MVELGNSSNSTNFETTATYDKNTREFIINSPTPTSAKWWVDAAANTANMTVVFAQLIVDGVKNGVHVFVVPIRDSSHKILKGIYLGDLGKKNSLNGVDDGYLIFNNYRAPYDSLLDKYSQITEEGEFKSEMTKKEKRLGIMLGGLIRGRLAVVSGTECNLKSGLAIALRYSALRKQFSQGQGPEIPILDYQMQRVRLMPILAQTFAVRAGALYLYNIYKNSHQKFLAEPECEELAEFNAILNCFKAVGSWYGMQGLQVCREACGGLGYSAFSGIKRLRSNQEALLVWEGDNTILLQQTSRYILKQMQKTMKAQKSYSITLGFLKLDPKKLSNPQLKFENNLTENQIIEAMELKINYLLHQSIQKLQLNAIKSESPEVAWNNTQVFYLADLARSYAEILFTKQLYAMASCIEAECKTTGEVMKKLAKLYAVDNLAKSLPLLFEAGVQPTSGKFLRDSVISLCEEIGEASIGIIDAIAPEDICLGSALGNSDGQAYAHLIKAVESHPNVYKMPEWLPIIKDLREKGKALASS